MKDRKISPSFKEAARRTHPKPNTDPSKRTKTEKPSAELHLKPDKKTTPSQPVKPEISRQKTMRESFTAAKRRTLKQSFSRATDGVEDKPVSKRSMKRSSHAKVTDHDDHEGHE